MEKRAHRHVAGESRRCCTEASHQPDACDGSPEPRRWWRVAGSAALGGLIVALVPKCPLCLAAWFGGVALGLGAIVEGLRGALW